MLSFIKKVIGSRLFKPYLLVMLLLAGFVFLGSRIFAYNNQINIFPGQVSSGQDAAVFIWQDAANALTQDLLPDARFIEFNNGNSAFLASINIPAAGISDDNSIQKASPAVSETGQNIENVGEAEISTEPAENAAEEENFNGADAFKNAAEEENSDDLVPENKIHELLPGLEPQEEAASPADQERAPSDEGFEAPANPSEQSESMPASQPLETEPSAYNFRMFFKYIKSVFADAFNKTIGGKLANAEIEEGGKAADDEKTGAASLIFSDFSLPDEYLEDNIGNVQLRLSMAGMADAGGGEFIVQYTLAEQWVDVGRISLDAEFSNYSNGGYFLFGLPVFESWSDIADLKVKISYIDSSRAEGINLYLDSIWLEVNFEKLDEAGEVLGADESPPDTVRPKGALELISPKINFKSGEEPEFNYRYKRNKSFIQKLWSGLLNIFIDEYANIDYQATAVKVSGKSGKNISPEIRYLEDGEIEVKIRPAGREIDPGLYKLSIKAKDKGESYLAEQYFNWGVLAFNTSKSIYLPAENAELQMAVLDNEGHTVCNAELFLEIQAPDGGIAYLNTDNGLIKRNPECGPDNIIFEPDYYADYGLAGEGSYKVKLISRFNGITNEITDQFEVQNYVPFEIERSGPTRIYPPAGYAMKFSIKANEDYSGEFREIIPNSFDVISSDYAYHENDKAGGARALVWPVDWRAGESYELSYWFDAPDISPAVYYLGRAGTDNFSEARNWQIAADAVTAYEYSSGSSVGWTAPDNAWNASLNQYASRAIPGNSANDSANYLRGNANNAPSSGGNIIQVEIGIEGYVQNTSVSARLVPVFGISTSTSVYTAILGATDTDTTVYVDVTNANGAPGTGNWTWPDVQNLKTMVYGVNTANPSRTLYVDQIRIRITYANPPTGAINSVEQKRDGSGVVDFSIEVNDSEGDNCKAKIEYISGADCELSLLDPTLDETVTTIVEDFGDVRIDNASPYQVGTTTGWIITTSGSNTVNFDWLAKTDLPSANGTYCVKLTVNDGSSDQTSPATTTLTIDNLDPTPPGELDFSTSTANTITLEFGTSTTETNFKEYRIYYKAGYGSVSESDNLHSSSTDQNLGYQDYGTATTTTINGLEPETQYSFNIWAYDQYGNKASSTWITATTSPPEPLRAKTVNFYAGSYSGNGTNGQFTDTEYSLPAFNFKLGEANADIQNAYVMLEIQFEAYSDIASNYTGYEMAFDACAAPCSPDPFNGTSTILNDDNTILAYDEEGNNHARLLLDVTEETQLANYSGNSVNLSGAVGYNIQTGLTQESIALVRALLVVTYSYNHAAAQNITNTVIYPLESTASGDSGTRRSSFAGDCSVDYDCPLFDYNAELAEFSDGGSRISQWFNAYIVADNNAASDVNFSVNIEGTDVDSDVVVFESANGGTQGNAPASFFSGVAGYSENSDQSLEMQAMCPGSGDGLYYLYGGEVVETYLAPKNAPTKTKTVSFPLGVITNGNNTNTNSRSVNIYLPENGNATGTVEIKSAWFRVVNNTTKNNDYSITVSSRVGNNLQSANWVYPFNPGLTEIKSSLVIVHIIPSSDYSELALANATTSKQVTLNLTNSSNQMRGSSAELFITYSYTDDSSGYLSSHNLFAGQTNVDADATLATTSVALSVLPEYTGSKIMRAGGLFASYLVSDSDGSMPNNGTGYFDANLAISSPTCSTAGAFQSLTDATNLFVEFNKDVLANMNTSDSQSYVACYANDQADASAGAKMSGSLVYTYQYIPPPIQFVQNDWRWYANSNSRLPGSPQAGENTPLYNINLADILRLRINAGPQSRYLATSTDFFKLQFGSGSDCTAVSNWQDAGQIGSSTAWTGYNNPIPPDGDSASSTLLASSTAVQSYEESNPTAYNKSKIEQGGFGEWDWTLYNNSATSSTDYCFRMVFGNNEIFTNYNSDGYPKLTTAASNTAPLSPYALGQYRGSSGTTTIDNQAWTNDPTVRLVAQATDVNINESVALYYELVTATGTFTTSTSAPASFCSSATAYSACGSKIWAATSSLGDYRTAPFRGTTTITGIPDNYTGYKWQVLSCDDGNACSNWVTFDSVPNFRVDATPPTPPGALSSSEISATSITLAFGATTTETNFLKYRIFYKVAPGPVLDSGGSIEHSDSDLNNKYYNYTSTTTANSLSAGTQYVFNIWAYDQAGNKATASPEMYATTTSSFTKPIGSIQTVSQKTDGSGAIDIAISADDADNDDTLRAKVEYVQGACNFLSPLDPYIDEDPANTTDFYPAFPDPDVDNNAEYQVGTTTGWILTSPGPNYVFFDWLSKNDIPSANETYCIKVTLNDGLYDQATPTTRQIMIDNYAPSQPGPLTFNDKDGTSILLNFGDESFDTHFYRYRIFYKIGSSGVTESDIEHNDSNLEAADYKGATTTLITGLAPNTQYVFNIWAYDDYGNRASSTQEVAVKTNGYPYNIASLVQYRADGMTEVSNQGWTSDDEIKLKASVNDPDTSDLVTLYFQFIANAGTFLTATAEPSGACVYGTAFADCGSGVWFVASTSPGDYSVTPFTDTVSITEVDDSAAGYKWQVLACDSYGDCADSWVKYDAATPNIKVDTQAPTSPGELSENAKTANSITLNFGATTTEANFSMYKIYYSTSSPVTDLDYSFGPADDPNLGYIDYFGASITTIEGLQPQTTYYLSIWAYDLAGNKASSTETSVNTNAVQSTPGVLFYTKNSQVLYYRLWDGDSWGQEQSGPTLGSAAGDNIRHIKAIRSDDGGKVGIFVKTWDGANQEWWGTVYRAAANDFVNSQQLGTAYASASDADKISGDIASLSGSEFFVVRTNNGANGTQVYSWSSTVGWVAEPAGPNPSAVLVGCKLVRRPGTDNYIIVTFDDTQDIGTSYYYGGASYANSWITWKEHSTNETDANNFSGDAFFDPSDNTRGAVNYHNSLTSADTVARQFIADNSSLSFVTATTSAASWSTAYVHGEFAADPGTAGTAYLAGRDTSDELNVIKLNISGGSPAWSLVTNGDNISAGNLYDEANYAQKPFSIIFYKSGKGAVVFNENNSTNPKYRVITASADSLDPTNLSVPGSASSTYSRVRAYKDPNEQEFISIFQDANIDYSAIFWNGASNRYYNSVANPGSKQVWTALATSTGALDQDDECTAFAFTKGNSAPQSPYAMGQFKSDASTTISNAGWTNQDTIILKASAKDVDTSEIIGLYAQFISSTSTFATSTVRPEAYCTSGTAYGGCASKIWLMASSTLGDYSITPFSATASITAIPDSPNPSTGYKWQILACDDEGKCSSWVKFNTTIPNVLVDTTPPGSPGNLTILGKNSYSITLGFGASSSEANFKEYRIYYATSSPVATSSLEHDDPDLDYKNYNNTSSTTVINLASSTLYHFKIWAFDWAGNYSSSTEETSTTTNAAPYLRQKSFLLENDDGNNVNSNTAAFGIDATSTGLYIGERLNVRLQIENTGGDSASSKIYKLQYENYTDAPGAWLDVGAATPISFAFGLSGNSGATISAYKAAFSTYTFKYGYWYEDANTTGAYTLPNNYFTEFVFAVKTNYAVASKTYRLRLVNVTDAIPLQNYAKYAAISIAADPRIKYSKEITDTLSTGTSSLAYPLDPQGYTDVSLDDDIRDIATSSSNIPVYMFATRHATNTDAIAFSWNGQSSVSAASAPIYLQVFRFGSFNNWVTLATNTTAAANTDFTATSSVNKLLSEYYDGADWTYWRIYQQSGTQVFRTDHATTTFSPAIPETYQAHFRWREDNGDETAADWREDEDDGDPTDGTPIDKLTNLRLRIEAVNLGGGSAANYAYRLEYAPTAGNCLTDPGGWQAVPAIPTTEHFEMATSSYFANGDNTTPQLNNTEGYSFTAGKMVEDPSSTTTAISLTEQKYTEIEYVIQATSNAASGGTYCFRITNAGTELDYYPKLAEMTVAGILNTKPIITINPSDGGSSTTSPTTYGTAVNFTLTASTTDGGDYYLAVCQTDSITPGNDAPPTCNGGNWCISSLASSTFQASCSYTTATATEMNPWFAYACDKHPGTGIAKCSDASTGNTGTDADAPFNVNHRPVYNSVTTLNDNQDPGGTFIISTDSADTDIAGGADTLKFYVCLTDDAGPAGCTYGGPDTLCFSALATSTNVSCQYTDTAPTPSGTTTYYAYLFDSHNASSSPARRVGTYTIKNTPPNLGTLILNNNNTIDLYLKGTTTPIQTVNTSIIDQNGCDEIVSATAVIYFSNVAGGSSCAPDYNNCYSIGIADCIKSDCTGGSDIEAAMACTANLEYYAIPTADDAPLPGNPNEPYDWLSEMTIFDGYNYISTTSAPVELATNIALDVEEDYINFGTNMYMGENTGSTNQTTTVVNIGNSPVITNLSGTDMVNQPFTDSIGVTNIKWDLNNFNWQSGGTALTAGGDDAPIYGLKPTSTTDVYDLIYWGIGIPFGSDASQYYGENTFSVEYDPTSW